MARPARSVRQCRAIASKWAADRKRVGSGSRVRSGCRPLFNLSGSNWCVGHLRERKKRKYADGFFFSFSRSPYHFLLSFFFASLCQLSFREFFPFCLSSARHQIKRIAESAVFYPPPVSLSSSARGHKSRCNQDHFFPLVSTKEKKRHGIRIFLQKWMSL